VASGQWLVASKRQGTRRGAAESPRLLTTGPLRRGW